MHVLALAAMIVTLVKVIIAISGQASLVTSIDVANTTNFVLLRIHDCFKTKVALQVITILVLLIFDFERFVGKFDRVEFLFAIWARVFGLYSPSLNAFEAEFVRAAIDAGANCWVDVIKADGAGLG